MTSKPPVSEYLVISRGQWDADKSKEEIQTAIDDFYVWYEDHLAQGRIKPGQRLAVEGKRVATSGITDGPFAEAKEVIGGYWFVMAASLDEAAALSAGNPCMACGLSYDVRPIEAERCSAYAVSNETPHGAG
ncbi:MAG: YciI family protein [Pseudomonadota bacterium]